LQRHLIRNEAAYDGQTRLFVVDESSLASTKQMNEFFHRLHTSDRVLLVGDTRQHEAVEAGRPYKQLQEAGMQTAGLGEILRQKDPNLKEVVEQLARGDVFGGIASLDQQGRVHEIVNSQERFSAIAREYSRHPEGTLVISPDNESRRKLNSLIHRELQNRADVSRDEHKLRVLESRQELTGADRRWAGRYEIGDVLRYTRGSKALAIEAGEYARVSHVDPNENLLTIERENRSLQTYDPRRLSGVSVHRELEREFSKGDRIQFTAPSRELKVANRELGTIERVTSDGDLTIRLDSGREVRFNIGEHAHLDHGYAVPATAAKGKRLSAC